MFFVLTGTDSTKIKKRIAELTRNADITRFGEGGEAFSNVFSHLGAPSLFSQKNALVLVSPLEDAEAKEIVLQNLKAFSDSETIVVVTESHIDAATTKKIEKHAEAIESYELKKTAEAPVPNVFALADAFAKGDRKKAWVLYRQFIENGSAPEEIHGTLSWQARAMVLASKTKSAEEAGLKPFAYTKAKAAVARFTPEAVEDLSRELVTLYHQSRMGQGSLEDLLEVFLLKKN